jgi:hypothetical protein
LVLLYYIAYIDDAHGQTQIKRSRDLIKYIFIISYAFCWNIEEVFD